MSTDTTTIWIDADAAPRAVKDVCIQVSERRRLAVVLVANQRQFIAASPLVRFVTVGSAFDAADDHIADNCGSGDLVITADVPLAARVVARARPSTPRESRAWQLQAQARREEDDGVASTGDDE